MKKLVKLALPLAFGSIASALGELVVRGALGRYSEAALAASLPGAMLAMFFAGVFLGTSGYSTVMVSRRFGKNDEAGAYSAFFHGLRFAVLSLPVFLAMALLGVKVIGWAGHDPAVAAAEKVYFVHTCAAAYFTTITTALSAWFAGRGRTLLPGVATTLGFLLEMFLAPLLINGKAGVLPEGIGGAGMAKLLGAVVPVVIIACGVPWRRCAFDGRMFGELIRKGLPVGLNSLVGSGVFMFFAMQLGRCGVTPQAIANICFSLNNVFWTLLVSIGSAVTIRTGLGRDPRREAMILMTAILTVYYSALLVFRGKIMLWFFPDAGEQAFGLFGFFLAVLVVREFFEGIQVIYSEYLRGVGRTMTRFLVPLITYVGVWLPLSYIFGQPGCERILWFVMLAVAILTALGYLLVLHSPRIRSFH